MPSAPSASPRRMARADSAHLTDECDRRAAPDPRPYESNGWDRSLSRSDPAGPAGGLRDLVRSAQQGGVTGARPRCMDKYLGPSGLGGG